MNKRELADLVRLNIEKMNSYSSARDQYNIKDTESIYLDANESPFENGVNRYPDNKHYELKTVVSKIKNVQESQIVFGNGMDEILDLIVRVFCDPSLDQIITLPPTYGMYNVIASTNNVENIEVPLNSDFSINVQKVLSKASEKTKIIFLCSPNNPTGNSFKYCDVLKLINEFDGIIVLDEAYIDFSSNNSLTELINEHDNLIITQTLSKAYGMAGLRLGMGLSNKKIIDYINKIKPPYNINSLSEKKVLSELKNIQSVKKNIMIVLNEKLKLQTALVNLFFVEKVFNSDANFLLVKVDDVKLRCTQLLKNGIIVRDRSNDFLCENCLRITVGTPAQNRFLIKTLITI
ncbi:histidinol-phosphate transaminase [Flavobacteriaceae bacterium]|jgi:histidinol-phosphate aminotransferase|nr:histidinol-phosphate transaminase [Flavobacteriaceae bacterium]|tara:strand:- start:2118 stop:3161 length:1044 start_codon:yes stop_codon:yes gene_type:complete